MATDSRGNKLAKGDSISLQLPSTLVAGDIAELTEGGINIGGTRGGPQKTAGFLIVLIPVRVDFHPDDPVIHNAMKLHRDSDAQKSVLEMPKSILEN